MKAYAYFSAAREEYIRAGKYYSNIDPEVARRFQEEIERLIVEIRGDPHRFRFFEGRVQRHFSMTFPYAVLFMNQSDRIVIVAVMHMKRAPGYWRARLK